MFNIVLVEPEIPPNTGNIARTCAVVNANLHLVKPLGFSIDNKYVKRAGLDYWDQVSITVHDSLEAFMAQYSDKRFFLATTKTDQVYSDIAYQEGDYILFGSETRGLSEALLKQYPEQCITIPMTEGLRSLNLSNAVAIVVYEAWRQQNFKNSR